MRLVAGAPNSMVNVSDLLDKFVTIHHSGVLLQASVTPVHRFEAHIDAVTTISWSPSIFATGSARAGADTLLCHPSPRQAPGHDWDGVSRILVNKELLVITVGNRVMTWKVGPAATATSINPSLNTPLAIDAKLNVTDIAGSYER